MFEVFVSAETEPDFVSRMIMKFTKSPYSHIGILEDGKTIWHATEPGFHCQPLEEFMPGHVIHRIPVPVKDIAFARGFVRGMAGKAYSNTQYLGFILKPLAGLVDNNRAKTICSESVMDFMRECCAMPGDLNHDFVTPQEAWEAVVKFAATPHAIYE